jgi:hypothetical protein
MQIITLKTVMNAILVATFLVVSDCASETYLHGKPASSLSDVAILDGPSEVVLNMIDDETLPQPKIGGLTPIDGWEPHIWPGQHEIIVFLNSADHKSRTTLTRNFARGKGCEVRHRIESGARGRATWVAEIHSESGGAHAPNCNTCSGRLS